MSNEKRYSVRGFIVQNNRLLLQSMTHSNDDLLVDTFGSFVSKTEDKVAAIRQALKEQAELNISSSPVKKAAIVNYTIHKSDSRNNKVETTVFILSPEDNVDIEIKAPWKWYAYSDIPYGEIYPDVRLWLPRLLQGQQLNVSVEVEQSKEYAKSKIIDSTISQATIF